MPRFICFICKNDFYCKNSKAKFCGQKCYGFSKKGKPSWNKGTKGLMNSWNKGKKGLQISWLKGKKLPYPVWNKGKKASHMLKFINRKGYVRIYKPEHHRADSRGNVLEHIFEIEKTLGRILAKGEVVHHINGIRHDNQPENLMVFPNQSEHIRYHLLNDEFKNKIVLNLKPNWK